MSAAEPIRCKNIETKQQQRKEQPAWDYQQQQRQIFQILKLGHRKFAV
jgi:hypothetical protein